jgi:Domain of unknown function (DUF4440)
MNKVLATAALTIGLVFYPSAVVPQTRSEEAAYRDACIQRCVTRPMLGDPEMERQEIVSLEREAARAIQQSSSTFFHRVYSDDFAGTLSHGQQITKDQWIAAVVSPSVKRESFNISDIKVRVFEETAIATCLWSSKFVVNGQTYSSQIRAMHVYVNTPNGWHVVSGQTTNLPPDVQQPL